MKQKTIKKRKSKKKYIMKSRKLKIVFVLIMLIPYPFSCVDKNECLDLEREPYFSMQEMVFKHVDSYSINLKTNKLMWHLVSQDYENTVYPCDSLAMYFECPEGALLFHSQINKIVPLNLTQEAYACNGKRNGWAGTRDLVSKIFISSNFDFDETHDKNDNLSDIVGILAYTRNATEINDKWVSLEEYNKNSPYEAPHRFHLILKRKPTRSMKQQFVIKYYMENEPDKDSKYFIITTPVFHVR